MLRISIYLKVDLLQEPGDKHGPTSTLRSGGRRVVGGRRGY